MKKLSRAEIKNVMGGNNAPGGDGGVICCNNSDCGTMNITVCETITTVSGICRNINPSTRYGTCAWAAAGGC